MNIIKVIRALYNGGKENRDNPDYAGAFYSIGNIEFWFYRRHKDLWGRKHLFLNIYKKIKQ